MDVPIPVSLLRRLVCRVISIFILYFNHQVDYGIGLAEMEAPLYRRLMMAHNELVAREVGQIANGGGDNR